MECKVCKQKFNIVREISSCTGTVRAAFNVLLVGVLKKRNLCERVSIKSTEFLA